MLKYDLQFYINKNKLLKTKLQSTLTLSSRLSYVFKHICFQFVLFYQKTRAKHIFYIIFSFLNRKISKYLSLCLCKLIIYILCELWYSILSTKKVPKSFYLDNTKTLPIIVSKLVPIKNVVRRTVQSILLLLRHGCIISSTNIIANFSNTDLDRKTWLFIAKKWRGQHFLKSFQNKYNTLIVILNKISQLFKTQMLVIHLMNWYILFEWFKTLNWTEDAARFFINKFEACESPWRT